MRWLYAALCLVQSQAVAGRPSAKDNVPLPFPTVSLFFVIVVLVTGSAGPGSPEPMWLMEAP